jgi:hypothetical protein
VNAAFNIAATSCVSEKAELHRMRTSHRQMRKLARMAGAIPENGIQYIPDLSSHREILSLWEDIPVIPGEV